DRTGPVDFEFGIGLTGVLSTALQICDKLLDGKLNSRRSTHSEPPEWTKHHRSRPTSLDRGQGPGPGRSSSVSLGEVPGVDPGEDGDLRSIRPPHGGRGSRPPLRSLRI